jgi:RNA polymerase sigma-70 factor (ECF subfamily)
VERTHSSAPRSGPAARARGGALSGPDEEFAAFVESIERRLASYLRYAARGADDADDVFQDVCVAAYRNWTKVRGLERPSAWAVRVARNLLINRAKHRAVELRAQPLLPAGAAPAADRPADERELRDAVAAALASLPEQEREAVSMKVWGDLNWREIGEALGVSDDTAARLFARGLRVLAPRLQGLKP